jgi:hypothetical protein
MNQPGSFVVLLAAASALFAQDGVLPNGSQCAAPDVRGIVEASVAATQRHWRAWVLYSYLERDETRHMDPTGQVKSAEVEVSRAFLVEGARLEQLVERNGRPLPAEEQRRQREELDRVKRLPPGQRAVQLRREIEENSSLVAEVPKAFDFQFAGEDTIGGRPAWVLQAAPHPGYQAQGKYGRMFSKVAGKLWVDKQDFGWIRVDGQVIQPFSMGLFLARVLRGSRITVQQTRVAEGLWMPERIEVLASAKILFVKSLVIDRVLSYSEYSPPGTAAP